MALRVRAAKSGTRIFSWTGRCHGTPHRILRVSRQCQRSRALEVVVLTRRLASDFRRNSDYPYVPFCMEKGGTTWVLEISVSLWDSLMFGRLAMGFTNVRGGYSSTKTRPVLQARRCSSSAAA